MAEDDQGLGEREPIVLEPGLRFDDFELVEPIGKGGMGTIWRARELALQRDVALKFLRPSRLASAGAVERFQREARALARVKHPGIVVIYSVGHALGQPYIAQELIEGGRTLGDFIGRAHEHGERQFRHLAGLVAEAADALQAAHEAGVVHRDVKPNNLLITPDGHIKVADFGLARVADAASVTDTGVAVGTFPYSSPEQILGRRDLDGRTDVFGLGATLYELLTRRRAFEGDSPNAIVHRVLNVDPPEPRTLDPRIPPELAVLCSKALEKRPEDRFASMGDLRDELRRYLADEPLRTHSPSTMQRARKWVRRHPGASATAGVALTGLCAVTWLGVVSAGERRERRVAECEALLANTQWAVEMGDLARAEAYVSEVSERAPTNYTGHLILASGFAKYARLGESQRQIELAHQKGFSSDPSHLETALEHGAYGLYLKSKLDFALYPEAERHIQQALRLDPTLVALHFALYQMRAALDDVPGARAALREVLGQLRPADPFSVLVRALDQELSGDPAGALTTLEGLALRSEIDEVRLKELSWHRNVGRLCVRVGDLARGEAFLRQAVADAPDDCWSWSALAALHVQRFQGGSREPGQLDAAEEAAARALACSPSLVPPLVARAFVAVQRCELEPLPADPGASPSWRAARQALEALEAVEPGATAERSDLEAQLALLEARSPFERKDYTRAAELLERALDGRDVGLQAAALLGQCLWYLGRFEQGQAVLAGALERWDDDEWEGRRESRWLGALLAWSLGHAVALGDGPGLDSSRERLVLELERGTRFEPEELLSAAEFLTAEAPAELRDCELGLALVADHDLEHALEGRAPAEAVRGILRRIEDACR